ISCAILSLLLCGAASIPDAAAQEPERVGFAVSMDSRALSGRPGQTIDSELVIVVEGPPQPSAYDCEAFDLGLTPAGEEQLVPRGEGARSCAGWIRLESRVAISAGARSRTVPFSVSIPADATGEYFGYIRVKRIAERSDQRIAVMLEPAIALRVEISVPGRLALELAARSLVYDPWLHSGGPGLILEVRNSGTAKSPLEGDILLYRGSRGWPLRVAIPVRDSGNPIMVYPGLSVTVSCPLAEPPPSGDYRAVARLLLAGTWRTQSSFDIRVPAQGTVAAVKGSFVERAEFDLDLRVQPEYVEVALPAGASRSVSIRVQNADTTAVTLRAAVAEVRQELNGFLTFTETADTTGQWVRLPAASLVLQPRSAAPLLIEVRRPETAGEEAPGLRGVRLTGRAGWDESGWASEVDIGVPVFAVPAGAPPPRIEIERLDVVRPDPALNPTAVLLRLRNAGGRVALISGSLWVERAATRQRIQTLPLGGGVLVAPGTAREFRMAMPYLDKGDFRLIADVQVREQPASAGARREALFDCRQGPD
ncbi:MAG: hypothetical protein FJY75_06140, partial [Candidatus Eisenbacteria bacterium]|nr:hypothetical protein [Candidatus Eisenbacteria bacterium]